MINLTFETCLFYGKDLALEHEPELEIVNHNIF